MAPASNPSAQNASGALRVASARLPRPPSRTGVADPTCPGESAAGLGQESPAASGWGRSAIAHSSTSSR
eukprot:13997409-Alexandrium_andersonii.AAC.1